MTRARDVANLIGSGNYSSTTFTATAGQTAFTISHTQGFVQVFMNGLLLDETVDYTSNGSAVTLTSGAAAGDEIEVVAYNTFSVGDALPKSGGAMTGALTVDAAAATVLTVDRATSLGTIIDIQKDGTTVGNVGVEYTDNLSIGGNSSHCKLGFGTSAVYPSDGDSSGSDADTDLGSAGNRFKDLYLSGGLYVGGTGASNHLNDYEEGTWTPDVRGNTTAGTITYGTRTGQYTKIGNMVTAWCVIDINAVSGAAGRFYIYGVPFTASSTHEAVSIAQYNKNYTALPTNVEAVAAIIQSGHNYIHMRGMYTDTTAGPYYVPIQRFNYLRISLTYKTA